MQISEPVSATIRNLSMEGLCLETPSIEVDQIHISYNSDPLKKNKVFLKWKLPDRHTIRAICETVWYERDYKGVPIFLVGLKFLKMSQEDRNFLSVFLQTSLETRRALLSKNEEEPRDVPEAKKIIVATRPWLTAPVAVILFALFCGVAFILWYFSTNRVAPAHPEMTEALWNYYGSLTSNVVGTTGYFGAFPTEVTHKPSVAVIPFVNESHEASQDLFTEGVSADVIRHLSTISDLFVVSPRSTFHYRGSSVRPQQVGSELGVKYIVQGNVQWEEETAHVTVTMADVETGSIIWNKAHEVQRSEVMSLVENMTHEISESLVIQDKRNLFSFQHGDNVDTDAYDYLLQGICSYHYTTRYGNAEARAMFNQAASIDPEFARAYALSALTHLRDIRYGWSESPDQSLNQALDLTQKALRLDDGLPEAHAAFGHIHLLRGEHEEAVAKGKHAVSLDPNGADAHALLAMSLLYSGKYEESIERIERAIKLSPFHPPWYLMVLGSACFHSGEYTRAIVVFEKLLEIETMRGAAHRGLAMVYAHVGELEEALSHAAELLSLKPSFSIKRYEMSLRFKDPNGLKREINALRGAGLK